MVNFQKGCEVKMATNLKIERIKKGFKQKELASMVGITAQYLMNLESGKATNPSIPLMKKLASALECSVEELFFNDEAAATAEENK